ncbi:hypothetical protein RND71_020913 [Anisodus tanguticus]|uniref:dolichol kinase n=1 Tax=Anisodus tanguticus TaxID=243964 RepID=A0AAE1RWT0_9SOLA|nr:hypothetical protein RND71_020913 [Anisodus tanguticus]
MALSLFLNGERAVVALFIARIVFSIPQSLMFESLSLSLLSLLALFVEIAVDQLFPNSISKRFKISDSARAYGVKADSDSKGSIVKWSWNWLMVSKLIQLLRAASLNEVGIVALIFQPKFLDLAFGAALAVFLVLEAIRIWKIWPLGQLVHRFLNAFTDHRDSDLLIVSHFSLLLGCALPIWLSSGFNGRPLAPFAGILNLGIGDTMASLVGHKYGVLRWSKTGKKTIEGTAAGITSVLATCSVLLPLLATTGYILDPLSLSP